MASNVQSAAFEVNIMPDCIKLSSLKPLKKLYSKLTKDPGLIKDEVILNLRDYSETHQMCTLEFKLAGSSSCVELQ